MMQSYYKMMDQYASDDEVLLLLLLLRKHRRRLRAASRTTWVKQWVLRRQAQGAHANLIRELSAEDQESFRRYHRLDRESFEEILAMVGPHIRKKDTIMRSAISPRERLSVTLRFLASGETFRSLSFQFRMGERTISGIVEETCEALYAVMMEQFLKTPSSVAEWLKVAEGFQKQWNYPCCIGAIDGKHIAIKQPSYSGSEFFNYKHFFSILLLAVVDANYKFIYVDVGAAGREGDAGVFNESALKTALDANSFNLPPPENIGRVPPCKCNYHIIGDDAFPMSVNLMKPYPHRHLENEKRIFNYRLSRARRVVENAFGIFANRFRVFLTGINLSPDRVTYMVLAACCLHNYLVTKNNHSYASVCDVEDVKLHTFTAGAWRNDPPLTGMAPASERNSTTLAKEQRNLLTTYFSSEAGSVPWQDNMIAL